MRAVLPLLLTACTGMGAATDLAMGTAHDELMTNVEQLRQAEIALQVVDDFLPCSDEATARKRTSTLPRTWEADACWARIGWQPDVAVRGAYWVEVTTDASDFTVHGIADPEGDGMYEHVVATRSQAAAVAP